MIGLSFLGSAHVAGKVLLTILPDETFPLYNEEASFTHWSSSLPIWPCSLTKGTRPQSGSHPCWPTCHVAWAQHCVPVATHSCLQEALQLHREEVKDANKWDLNCVQNYENQHISVLQQYCLGWSRNLEWVRDFCSSTGSWESSTSPV